MWKYNQDIFSMLYAYEKEKSVGPKEREKKCVCVSPRKRKNTYKYMEIVCVHGVVSLRVRVCVYNNKSKCV